MRRPILLFVFALIAPLARADEAAAVQTAYRDWMLPRAVELATAATRLTDAVGAYCFSSTTRAGNGLEAPRQAWRESLSRWERLATVAIGPVLEQRMQRKIDFQPTRPRSILKAIKAAPATAADMELIGTPAKGFPALEWLLWTQPAQPGTPACAYGVRVAREIGAEALHLEQDYRQAVARHLEPEAAKTALGELVNQWVGGLERLRWANMEMPVRVAGTSGPDVQPDYPRQASGVMAASWAAQWDALRHLAGGPLAGLLRERGKSGIADALVQAVAKADGHMTGLSTSDKAGVLAAAADLAALKAVMENQVAPALGVSIGFSDSDGD